MCSRVAKVQRAGGWVSLWCSIGFADFPELFDAFMIFKRKSLQSTNSWVDFSFYPSIF